MRLAHIPGRHHRHPTDTNFRAPLQLLLNLDPKANNTHLLTLFVNYLLVLLTRTLLPRHKRLLYYLAAPLSNPLP